MKTTTILGLLAASSMGASAASVALLPLKDVESFSHRFSGSDIHDGTSYQNGWTGTSPSSNFTLSNTGDYLNIVTVGTGGSLNGTNASNGSSTWSDAVSAAPSSNGFTFEASLRVNSASNGFNLWTGGGTDLSTIAVYDDKLVITRNGRGTQEVAFNFADGAFHTIRLSNEAGAGNNCNHVWVDGVLITDPRGAVYNSGSDDSRLIIGDTTGGSFGNSYNIDIGSISFDSGTYAPTPIPEPRSTALLGIAALGLLLRRR